MYVCVESGILLVAHGSFSYFFVASLQLTLRVDHLAMPGTVHTLASVRV